MTAAARLILGDCVEAMAAMPDESVHSIVCDPPYGLEFMGKTWDTFRVDQRSARWAGTERTGGAGAGFAEGLGGAVLPAFGRRRTTNQCRTCGKRDAFRNPHKCGDEADWVAIPVDDSPMEMRAFQNWVSLWAVEAYRILKPGGHLLAFGGTRTYHRLACGIEEAGFDIRDSLHWIYGSGFPKSLDVSKQLDKRAGAEREVVGERPQKVSTGSGRYNWNTAPEGTGRGETFDVTVATSDEAREWDGWGTALKPSHEPVVMARKPLAGTVAETVLAHGTGALNIEAARVGSTVETWPQSRRYGGGPTPKGARGYDGGETVQTGVAPEGRWPANILLAHLPDCQGEGPNHTDVLCAPGCPVAELNEQAGERAAGASPAKQGLGSERVLGEANRSGVQKERDQLDGGAPARFFYIAKPKTRERVGGSIRNLHPTVKPVTLMRWLVRLVTPPDGVVLDPFLGSGTTGCAAMAEGLRFIGVERDEASYETACARIADWAFANNQPRPEKETL